MQGRVFVRPPEVLAFWGTVAADLPYVRLHLHERSSSHVCCACAAVSELMYGTDAVPVHTGVLGQTSLPAIVELSSPTMCRSTPFSRAVIRECPRRAALYAVTASGPPRESRSGSAIGTWMARLRLFQTRARSRFDFPPFATASSVPWRCLQSSQFRPSTRRPVRVR